MAQNTAVPKFGNWETEENVPYTAYFEKARKGRSGGRKMSRTDSQQNSGSFSTKEHSFQASSFQEDIGFRSTDSPLRLNNYGGHKGFVGHNERAMQWNSVSNISIEHSQNQTNVGGKGNNRLSSHTLERKISSEGSHAQYPMTPGRSRLRSLAQDDDSVDHSTAIPKFGGWDESNPTSADGYTYIFNRVRQEKQGEAGKADALPTETCYSNGQKHYGNKKSKSSCCFLWC